ncbi:YbaB/EbfC family nucleoid-associated protein [Nocardia sp. NPDC052566]|uniref:YbaB/EbfC family nucleoid-associated protein n=1 Tax=Nocardia sp. NPDC052566 TaxID=3364330 RepID=UPI0037C8EF5F
MNDVDIAQERLQDHTDRLVNFGAELAAIRAEETSQNGEVSVAVNGVGAIVELRLSEAISRMTVGEFERVLVETAGAAARHAFARQAELIESFNAR